MSKHNDRKSNDQVAARLTLWQAKMAENKANKDPFSNENSLDATKETATTNMKLDAKKILREVLTASLATIHHEEKTPYASLVTVAADADGSPILLLSDLAVHTKNLIENQKACLLMQSNEAQKGPLESGRLSVWGDVEKTTSPRAKNRFLSRHPDAEVYAEFSDFSFFKLNIENAHYVGGFGQIRSLSAEDLSTNCDGCDELIELETGFLKHMNNDHSDSVAHFATQLLGEPDGDWRLTGIDPEGMDLMSEQISRRLNFDIPVKTPDDMKKMLETLANQAKDHAHGHHEH